MSRTDTVVLALLLIPQLCFAGRPSRVWDEPAPVDPNTVFFGEVPDPEKTLPGRPDPEDKSYPWYFLEKGNKHFLAGELEKAEASYREAYSVPGSTRVLSGFKLVETLQKMGRVDSALETLDQLTKNYLVSTRESEEARHLRTALLDEKRKGAVETKTPPLTGRQWSLQISEWRVKFVLKGMDNLRLHGVPLKESYQKYVFLLDEYFLAHPDADASDPSTVLAGIVYERDASARIPIDSWRADPDSVPPPEIVQADGPPKKIIGGEWITMTFNEKRDYVEGAMTALQNQRVPMKKSLYGYVDALDKFFTQNPDLPASNSVVALASFLYRSESDARQVLEALRLQ